MIAIPPEFEVECADGVLSDEALAALAAYLVDQALDQED